MMRNSNLRIVLVLVSLIFVSVISSAQTKKEDAGQWKTISDDEEISISYNTSITTSKNGNHFVWVKAVYHTPEWQRYFADMIGIRTPVVTTRTKAEYDEIYSYVRVRQVKCYSKAGKLLYDSGDDRSAGWYPVNAGDPVGIVGEYLDKIQRRKEYGY